MPVKKCVNINGRTSYLTDAIGSITATVNSSQAVVNTYRWKRYGDRLAKVGTGCGQPTRVDRLAEYAGLWKCTSEVTSNDPDSNCLRQV